jgi:UDP-N-acetylmuramoylalanine--D-glutamate ligase
VGLGRAGLPAARALVAMGAEVTVWDDRPEARAAAEGLTVAEPVMAGLTALVLSPGIPHTLPQPHRMAAAAREAGVPILCDADLLYIAVRAAGSGARFAGITGTNGKSTTTALLAHILSTAGIANAAGANLGTAALALPLLGDDGVYVLEMSSYMLERIASLRFNAACMLNLSPDHLDRHGDMAGYAEAKRQIFARQIAGDTAIIGIDDAPSRAMADKMPGAIRISERDTPIATGPTLPGLHNAQNIAAATAMARSLGVSDAAIIHGIATYPGLPHRQERVAKIAGIDWINDSKATNADSTARALSCYDNIVWIAGGCAKEGGIESLVPYFPRIAHAFLIGRDAPMLAATLAEHEVPHSVVETLDLAVRQAAMFALGADPSPDVVLLSPACASWDQFTGFDQRGDIFRALAQGLA